MNKKKFNLPLRYILFILVFVCVGLMVASYVSPSFSSAVSSVGYTILAPMQNTLNSAGQRLSNTFSDIASISTLREENESLQARVDELEEQNTLLYQNLYELQDLRELYNISETYTQYEMTGARIIQKSSGNWYNEFVINKGTSDGIYEGANVLANGALVGRVTYAGSGYSRVLSIIDDTSNVGGLSQETGSYCVVSGDLNLYEEGKLKLDYIDPDATINEGDLIVTSNSSGIYFPNIAIGYAGGIEVSSNNLTQTGYLTPIVDFSSLTNVVVITTPNSELTIAQENAAAQSSQETAETAETTESVTGGEE